jgi:hypothetical protein
MAEARFQIFSRRARAVEWRLVGANNWALGQVGTAWRDPQAAIEDVHRLKNVIDRARVEVFVDRTGGWHWELRVDDNLLARSARAARRRSQCQAVVERFRQLTPSAPIDEALRTFW